MSQRDQLEVEMDQGEDFLVQMYWTDSDGKAVRVTTPARAEVRDTTGALVMQFASENSAATATKAAVTLSATSGLIQLSAPKALTRALASGRYAIDIWSNVTVDDATFTGSKEELKVCTGWLLAYPRTTIMEVAAV